jgi:chemotaxis methyl-accepting protein methylase
MRAHKRLNADGFLMLGSTETPQFLKVPFETVAAPAGALYRPV